MNHTIIDVREPDEFDISHVEKAINIPLDNIGSSSALDNIAKDSSIIVYCNSGSRSGSAMATLHELGYKNVINGINQQQVEANYKP